MDERRAAGQWVKQQREARDLTQQALAQRVGCARVTIHAIETGARRPSRQMADRLAVALGVPSVGQPTVVAALRGGWGELPAALPADRTMLDPFVAGSRDPADPLAAAVAHLVLHTALRLITLTGSDGVRKTRIGMQVLAHSAVVLGGRVAIVRLLGARSSEALSPGAIGDLLPAQSIVPSGEGRRGLLVVENVEGLVSGLVAQVLQRAPCLTVLATSSGPLGIVGECTVDVTAAEGGARQSGDTWFCSSDEGASAPTREAMRGRSASDER